MHIDFNTRESCENLVEGRTNFCSTHNRLLRKAASDSEKENNKRLQAIEKAKERKPRQQIAKQSDKMKEALRAYNARVKVWKVGNPECKAKCNQYCTGKTDDCQHLRGRGKYLMDESTWMPVCRSCHTYIGDHSKESYEKGWALLRLEKINQERPTI